MRILYALILAAVTTICFSGATIADEGKDESGKGRGTIQERSQHDYGRGSREYRGGGGDRSYFQDHGYTRLDIPKGHYPPPGECRIWFPERPAGQQPPPGKCGELFAQVPPGAWVIQHPNDKPDVVHINAYDERQPGVIRAVGEFNIGTGVFVRIVIGK